MPMIRFWLNSSIERSPTMKRQLLYLISSAAIVSSSVTAAEAQPRHDGARHSHHRYHSAERHAPLGHPDVGARYDVRARYPVDPRFGYEEAPDDPSYHGPGGEVFRRTIESAHEPGLATELDPDAKQTATGGPSGGLPSQSGGGGR